MTAADLFRLRADDLPSTARLVAFRGEERLCRPYAIDVFFETVDAPDFDVASAVGTRTTLRSDRSDGSAELCLHGVLETIEHVREVDGRGLYRAVLVPRLAGLGLGQHSRVFTRMSIPDILQRVLREAGLGDGDVELRLDATYPVEEHVCQYQESNLDFVHRWLEAEGMYYFFEQRDDREVVVITDHLGFHDALASEPVRYRPGAGEDLTAAACFDRFTARATARPAAVTVLDYDYLNPAHALRFSAPVDPTGAAQVMLHGARFFNAAKGQRLATVRAEELAARKQTFQASGTVRQLRTGYTFDLDEHPADRLNQRYLVTELRHTGVQAGSAAAVRELAAIDGEEVYRATATAIVAGVQFRPARLTAWPRIFGFERGIVDGDAESQYAQLDDQGRYRIKLGFDESELIDGRASTLVRMMQPHGGGVEGWHFPLRKGTEVVLSFLGGDPDRPVISGVLPNATTPSPVAVKNQTKNVIVTGGNNKVEIDDREGGEQFTMSSPFGDSYISFGSPLSGGPDPTSPDPSAPDPDPSAPSPDPPSPAQPPSVSAPASNVDKPHTMEIHTNGATLLWAGDDFDVQVGGSKRELVHGDVHETYLSNKREYVPSGTVDEEYCSNHQTVVHGVRRSTYNHHDVLVKDGRDERVVGGLRQVVVGDYNQSTGGNVVQYVNGYGDVSYDGPYKFSAATAKYLVKGPSEGLVAGGTFDTFLGGKVTNFFGGQTGVTYALSLTAKLAAEITITTGAYLNIAHSIRYNLSNGAKLDCDGSVNLNDCPMQISSLGQAVVRAGLWLLI